jgi:hypothetical protein
VSLPYATFGLAIKNGVCVAAPPIAYWAIGRDERKVAAYYRSKGATFRPLDRLDTPECGPKP